MQTCIYASVQCSRLVVSDSSRPQGPQHARPPCSSPTPGLLKLMSIESLMPSNHLILCHPLLLLPSVFPIIRSLPMSWLFPSRGQRIGASASASVLPMNIQGYFPLERMGLISLLSKGLSRVFSNTTVQKSILRHSAHFMIQLSHPYMTTGKTIALTRWTFVGKVMSLLLNMLSILISHK